MIGAGIQPRDILVVAAQDVAEDGQIVVALVGEDEDADHATVKYLHRTRGGRVELRAANPNYPPLRHAFVHVLGVARGLIRWF